MNLINIFGAILFSFAFCDFRVFRDDQKPKNKLFLETLDDGEESPQPDPETNNPEII